MLDINSKLIFYHIFYAPLFPIAYNSFAWRPSMSRMPATCRAFGARTLPAIAKAGERVFWAHSRRSSPPGKHEADGQSQSQSQSVKDRVCLICP